MSQGFSPVMPQTSRSSASVVMSTHVIAQEHG